MLTCLINLQVKFNSVYEQSKSIHQLQSNINP